MAFSVSSTNFSAPRRPSLDLSPAINSPPSVWRPWVRQALSRGGNCTQPDTQLSLEKYASPVDALPLAVNRKMFIVNLMLTM
jgi:hypothetical protein